MNIDELSPATIGEDKIVLAVDPSTDPPTALKAVQINVDYGKADAEGGVALPLDLIIQGPTQESYIARTYRRFVPKTLSFVPIAAGVHLVLLREQAHNRWVGRLRIVVIGDFFQGT
jgi:hypothetical protein